MMVVNQIVDFCQEIKSFKHIHRISVKFNIKTIPVLVIHSKKRGLSNYFKIIVEGE
jgi:hypothetical protein